MLFHFSCLIPLVFYRLVWLNGKYCPISRSRKQRGKNNPVIILVPSYEYGCVRPFRTGISLIYAGIHEDINVNGVIAFLVFLYVRHKYDVRIS